MIPLQSFPRSHTLYGILLLFESSSESYITDPVVPYDDFPTQRSENQISSMPTACLQPRTAFFRFMYVVTIYFETLE